MITSTPTPNCRARTTVVIIGGGIIGVCTAFFLARDGIPVVLCEKGEIAGEQSSRNWGWCRKMGRDPREVPLAIEALRLWNDMNTADRGRERIRRSRHRLSVPHGERTRETQAWLEQVGRPHQIDSRLLTRDQLSLVVPGLAGDWAGGAVDTERRTGGTGACRARDRRGGAAARRGAADRCAVRSVETEGGRICGVVTEKGPIACEQVVLAGGVWSRLFCGNLNLRLPQLKVTSAVMRIDPVEGGPETAVGRARLRAAQTARRRLHRRQLEPQRRRHRSRHGALRPRLPADVVAAPPASARRGWPRLSRESLTPRHWKPDQETPFERVRDPRPGAVEADPGRRRSSG